MVVVSSNGRSEITIKARKNSTGLSVETIDVTNTTGNSVTLNGYCKWDSNPKPTELGFYYGTNSNPTIGGIKVTSVVPNSSSGCTYQVNVSGLTHEIIYYIQAYATNQYGTEHGNIISFVARDYIVLSGLGIQKSDVSTGANYTAACKLCEESRVGGYSNWRLPTIGELGTIYSNKNIITGFSGVYWSKTHCGTTMHNLLWSGDGYIDCQLDSKNYYQGYSQTYYFHVRCVRTLP